MEFLLVVFDETRDVLVDDSRQGKTNIVLELEAGVHTVTLGPPFDFSPLEQKVRLRHTAPLDPYRIVFQRLPPSAIPHSPGTGPA
jgi:hypothetical protein